MRSYLFSVVALGLAASAMVPGAASAQDTRPAALVDTISVTVPGVQAMDYLRAGTKIDLGTDGKLVIDYLASCIREEIVGGTVQVGTQQSTVDKGKVSRRRVECDGAELQLSAAQSDQGGVAVYRSAMNKGADGLPLPDLVLQSKVPFFVLRQAGALKIERLDASDPVIELNAGGNSGGGGRVGVDLGQTGNLLVAGGLYRATAGERSLVFRVEKEAGGAEVARLSRMVPL